MATVIIVMSTRQQDEDGPMDVRWTIGFWINGGGLWFAGTAVAGVFLSLAMANPYLL